VHRRLCPNAFRHEKTEKPAQGGAPARNAGRCEVVPFPEQARDRRGVGRSQSAAQPCRCIVEVAAIGDKRVGGRPGLRTQHVEKQSDSAAVGQGGVHAILRIGRGVISRSLFA
jgi:hypothetical protein